MAQMSFTPRHGADPVRVEAARLVNEWAFRPNVPKDVRAKIKAGGFSLPNPNPTNHSSRMAQLRADESDIRIFSDGVEIMGSLKDRLEMIRDIEKTIKRNPETDVRAALIDSTVARMGEARYTVEEAQARLDAAIENERSAVERKEAAEQEYEAANEAWRAWIGENVSKIGDAHPTYERYLIALDARRNLFHAPYDAMDERKAAELDLRQAEFRRTIETSPDQLTMLPASGQVEDYTKKVEELQRSLEEDSKREPKAKEDMEEARKPYEKVLAHLENLESKDATPGDIAWAEDDVRQRQPAYDEARWAYERIRDNRIETERRIEFLLAPPPVATPITPLAATSTRRPQRALRRTPVAVEPPPAEPEPTTIIINIAPPEAAPAPVKRPPKPKPAPVRAIPVPAGMAASVAADIMLSAEERAALMGRGRARSPRTRGPRAR